jgi:hypothetical protein
MSRPLSPETSRVMAALVPAAVLVPLAYVLAAQGQRVAAGVAALAGGAIALYGSVLAWRLLRRSVVELVAAWREFERVQREVQDGGGTP